MTTSVKSCALDAWDHIIVKGSGTQQTPVQGFTSIVQITAKKPIWIAEFHPVLSFCNYQSRYITKEAPTNEKLDKETWTASWIAFEKAGLSSDMLKDTIKEMKTQYSNNSGPFTQQCKDFVNICKAYMTKIQTIEINASNCNPNAAGPAQYNWLDQETGSEWYYRVLWHQCVADDEEEQHLTPCRWMTYWWKFRDLCKVKNDVKVGINERGFDDCLDEAWKGQFSTGTTGLMIYTHIMLNFWEKCAKESQTKSLSFGDQCKRLEVGKATFMVNNNPWSQLMSFVPVTKDIECEGRRWVYDLFNTSWRDGLTQPEQYQFLSTAEKSDEDGFKEMYPLLHLLGSGRLCTKLQDRIYRSEILIAFNALDKDQDGFLESEDLIDNSRRMSLAEKRQFKEFLESACPCNTKNNQSVSRLTWSRFMLDLIACNEQGLTKIDIFGSLRDDKFNEIAVHASIEVYIYRIFSIRISGEEGSQWQGLNIAHMRSGMDDDTKLCFTKGIDKVFGCSFWSNHITMKQYQTFWRSAYQDCNWSHSQVLTELRKIHEKGIYSETFKKMFVSVLALKCWNSKKNENDDFLTESTWEGHFTMGKDTETAKLWMNAFKIFECDTEEHDIEQGPYITKKTWLSAIEHYLKHPKSKCSLVVDQLLAIDLNSFALTVNAFLIRLFMLGFFMDCAITYEKCIYPSLIDNVEDSEKKEIATKFYGAVTVNKEYFTLEEFENFWRTVCVNEGADEQKIATYLSKIHLDDYDEELLTHCVPNSKKKSAFRCILNVFSTCANGERNCCGNEKAVEKEEQLVFSMEL